MEKGQKEIIAPSTSSLDVLVNDIWAIIAKMLEAQPLARLRSISKTFFQNPHLVTEYEIRVKELFEKIDDDVIRVTSRAIYDYQKFDNCKSPGTLTGGFDKGTIRASHYSEILHENKINRHVKLLTVYALLTEKDGKRLKERVATKLASEFGLWRWSTLKTLALFLTCLYQITHDELTAICTAIQQVVSDLFNMDDLLRRKILSHPKTPLTFGEWLKSGKPTLLLEGHRDQTAFFSTSTKKVESFRRHLCALFKAYLTEDVNSIGQVVSEVAKMVFFRSVSIADPTFIMRMRLIEYFLGKEMNFQSKASVTQFITKILQAKFVNRIYERTSPIFKKQKTSFDVLLDQAMLDTIEFFNANNTDKIEMTDFFDLMRPENFMKQIGNLTHFFKVKIGSNTGSKTRFVELDKRFPFLVNELPEAESDKEIYFLSIADVCNDLHQLFRQDQAHKYLQ